MSDCLDVRASPSCEANLKAHLYRWTSSLQYHARVPITIISLERDKCTQYLFNLGDGAKIVSTDRI